MERLLTFLGRHAIPLGPVAINLVVLFSNPRIWDDRRGRARVSLGSTTLVWTVLFVALYYGIPYFAERHARENEAAYAMRASAREAQSGCVVLAGRAVLLLFAYLGAYAMLRY